MVHRIIHDLGSAMWLIRGLQKYACLGRMDRIPMWSEDYACDIEKSRWPKGMWVDWLNEVLLW